MHGENKSQTFVVAQLRKMMPVVGQIFQQDLAQRRRLARFDFLRLFLLVADLPADALPLADRLGRLCLRGFRGRFPTMTE